MKAMQGTSAFMHLVRSKVRLLNFELFDFHYQRCELVIISVFIGIFGLEDTNLCFNFSFLLSDNRFYFFCSHYFVSTLIIKFVR